MERTSEALRRRFFTDTLPRAIHTDPTPFYEAFEENEEAMAAWATSLFEQLCEKQGESLETQSCFPVIDPYVLEDTPDGFCALVTVTLEKTATAPEMTAAIVFGSAMDPRVFAGVPKALPKGKTLEIIECKEKTQCPVGVMHRGCDNGMQLFDPPNPQKVDKDAPLDERRRPAAFIDAVVCYCMEHD